MWLADGTHTTRQHPAQRSSAVIFYPQCCFHTFGQNKKLLTIRSLTTLREMSGKRWNFQIVLKVLNLLRWLSKFRTFSYGFESFEYSRMTFQVLNNLIWLWKYLTISIGFECFKQSHMDLKILNNLKSIYRPALYPLVVMACEESPLTPSSMSLVCWSSSPYDYMFLVCWFASPNDYMFLSDPSPIIVYPCH